MPENTQLHTFPTGGVATEKLFTLYDAGKPTYVRELAKRFGVQFDPFHNWLAMMCRDEAISGNLEWYAYEENRYNQTLKVLSDVASTGVGNDITFQLDPTYIDSTTGAYFGRVGDTVTIPGTGVQARIMSITGTAPNIYFTLKPINVLSNIGALTAGQLLSITNGGFGSGTGQPKGTVVGATKRTFGLQILKETVKFYGAEITKDLWYQAFDNNGQPVGYVTNATNRALALLNLKINGAMLLGQKDTNPSLTETDEDGETVDIHYMEGLIPNITRLGETSVVPAGTFAIDDIDDWGIYMRVEGVDSNVALMPVGARLRNDIENAAKAYIQGNGTDLTKDVVKYIAGTNDSDKLLSLGFCQIFKGGFNYLLKTINDFSDPVGLGATGYDYDQHGFIIPLTTFRDPVTGGKLDNIATKYVSNNGYNRRMEMWNVGGAGGNSNTYVTQYDNLSVFLRAHRGIQILKSNQMRYIKAS